MLGPGLFGDKEHLPDVLAPFEEPVRPGGVAHRESGGDRHLDRSAPEELQRRRKEAAAGSSSEEPAPSPQPAAGPPPASPGGGLPSIAVPAAASTGSGFLLGVAVWAGVLAYLRGGAPEVKKLINAKFFNKVGG